ncbi:MFS-type transporter SLC18B1 [Trichoplax sp. H2]|nr:MFS-type transporter SLC18B1 [Trichoplax sp. H2]|eukprot:RDD42134.1 MFS-type transporter SLC18B1 [Trichoplax sp. H2]
MADSSEVQLPDITRRFRLTIIVIFSCLYVVSACAYAIIAPFFPIVAEKRQITHVQLGIIFVVYSIVKAIFSPIVGILLPRVGVRYVLWAGLTIEAGSSILLGFLANIYDRTSFLLFGIILRGTQGLGSAMYQTAAASYITVICQDSVATVLGVLEIFTSIGFMVGPPVGGILYSAGGFKLPFIVLSSILLAASCIVAYMLPAIPSDSKSSPGKLMLDVMRIPRVIIICFGLALLLTSITFTDPTFTLHLKPLHLSKTDIGLVFLSLAGAYGVFSPLAGYICDRIGYRMLTIIGYLGAAISLQFLGPAPYLHLPLTVAQSVLASIGLGAAFSLAAIPSFPDILEAVSNSRYCQDKGQLATYSVTSGIFNGFLGLGQILGPLVGGVFVANAGVDFDWLAAILGFIFLAQTVAVIILTLWEGTGFFNINRALPEDKESNKPTGNDNNDDNESKPLLA